MGRAEPMYIIRPKSTWFAGEVPYYTAEELEKKGYNITKGDNYYEL